MESKDVHVNINGLLIDEIDSIRTARMTRTQFINEVLADWLQDRRNMHLRGGFPVNPGRTDWEAWKDIQAKDYENFLAQKACASAGR